MTYLKSLWARITVHWAIVVAAVIAALPAILAYLEVADIKPLLVSLGMAEATADLITKALPFILAFVRPMIAVAPVETKDPE